MPLYKAIVKKVSIPQDKKVKQKNYEEVGQLAVVDQGKDIIGGYSNDFDKRIECDLPVVVFGDHTCTVKYINFPFAAGADGIKILEPKDNVVPKYLYYGTKYLTLRFPEKGYARHYQHIEKMDLFLPTVSEQRRIVSCIEELFSKLDKGVETLQTIKQQLAVYRQAVYNSSFNKIRDFHPIVDFFEISGGLTKNSKRQELSLQVPYLRVANVYYNRLQLDVIKMIGVTQKELEKCSLKVSDLLFVEGNGSKSQIGRVAMWDGSIEACVHQNHLIKGRANGKVLPKYALYYLISKEGRKQIVDVAKSTSGLYTLSINKVKNLQIPFCSLPEQEAILNEIEARLSVCDSIEQTVDEALVRADAMRQSILKRAFEGKL